MPTSRQVRTFDMGAPSLHASIDSMPDASTPRPDTAARIPWLTSLHSPVASSCPQQTNSAPGSSRDSIIPSHNSQGTLNMKFASWLFGIAAVLTGLVNLLWREFEPAHQPIQAWSDHIP